MSEIDALELTSSTLSSWVLASIAAIIIGLFLELPELSERWKARTPHWIPQLGAMLVIAGLAGEFALHIWSDSVSDRIKAIQRAEIISLQKKLAPRELSQSQLSDLTEKMRSFSGTRFAVSIVSDESATLALLITRSLKDAGLEFVDWTMAAPDPGMSIWLPSERKRAGFVVLSGVEVHAPYRNVLEASHALATALSAAGLDGVRASPADSSTLAKSQNAEAMLLMVGSKPGQ